MTSALLAHAGSHHLSAAEVFRWWSGEPFVIVSLVLTAAVYGLGLRRVWRSAGVGFGVRRWEAAAFAGGWLALAAALVSPLDALGGVLFSAHMAQHEVLMLVAAPLMVLGQPLLPLLWALPAHRREWLARWARRSWWAAVWHAATGLLAVFVLHGLALWVWHLPRLYQATLRSDFVHALQHLSFFGTAALFWWALIHGRYGRAGYGLAVVYVFATGMHSGALGALLTFAPRVVYPIYEDRAREWNLSALEDQQLAGLIMWIPSGVVFMAIGLALFAAWLGASERRVSYVEPREVSEMRRAERTA